MTSLKKIQNQKAVVKPETESEFVSDVLTGLSAQYKFISPKYFYDEPGSRYFDEICDLEEYYPYRTELGLLPEVAKAIAKQGLGNLSVVEFGAGSLFKIRSLLEHIPCIKHYLPIDISGDFLRKASKKLSADFPKITVEAIEADFYQPVELENLNGKPLGFFPGSTIGNFTPESAVAFLENARSTLGDNSLFLVGVDTKKSPNKLHAAYNDERGVTAKFNLNILHRINRELNADIAVENFEHYAHFDAAEGCIKMFLVSLVEQELEIMGEKIRFKKGEAIHTESSYKYTSQQFAALAEQAGWRVENSWQAKDEMFSTYLLAA